MLHFVENADFITIHAKRAKRVLQKIPKYTTIDIGKFVQRKIIVYYPGIKIRIFFRCL